MTASLDLTPGQSVAQRFTLTRRMAGAEAQDQWLAEDEERGQQARLTFFDSQGSSAPAEDIRASISRAAAVVHPGLVKVLGLFEHDGAWVLAHDCQDASAPMGSSLDNRMSLSELLPLVETLAFVHDLGFAHGDLRAESLRFGQQRQVLLDGLGLTWVKDRRLPGAAEDIEALGVLLEQVSGAREGKPVSPALAELFAAMRGGPNAVRDLHQVNRRLSRALGLEPTVPVARVVAAPPAGKIEPIVRGTTGPARATMAEPQRRSVPMLLAMPVLLLMLVAVIYVLFFLPGPQAPQPVLAEAGEAAASEVAPAQRAASSQGAAAAQPGNSPFAAAATARERQAAQDAAMNLLRSLVALEERAAAEWAPDALAEARQAGEDGDALYREQSYAEALARYEEGITLAESLVAQSGDVLAEALQRGEEALAATDGEAARSQFERALAIDEENPRAKQGLERVGRLADVLEKMRRGAELEQDGQLAAARAEYEAARELDGQYAPATEALQRVAGRLGARRFQDLMSRGFRELDAGNPGAARSAFEQAARLRPNAAGPRDALAQVEAQARTRDIASRRRAAEEAETREDWQRAAGIYSAILNTDDTLVFAREGQVRAAARARLAERMQLYIDEPLRMASNPAYNDARAALAAARQVASPGPEHARQIAELEARVAVARDPVTVRLRSDGLTRVVILKLGEVGRFEEQAVGLVPGRYTAVGSRVGYRDVRREFEVRAGKPPAPISIICEEPV